jgi:hypothetical protein
LKKKILLVATVILISVGILGISKIVQDKYLNKNTAEVQQEEKDLKLAEGAVKEKDIQEQTIKEEAVKEEADKVETVKEVTVKEDVKPEVKKQETTNTKTSSTEKVVVVKKDAVVVEKEILVNTPEPKKQPNLIIKDDISGKTVLSVNISIENKTVADITRIGVGNNYAATGRGETTYFTRLYDLKARGAGPLSGWCYYVNGVKPGISSGAYKLKSGDIVMWKYLKDAVNN